MISFQNFMKETETTFTVHLRRKNECANFAMSNDGAVEVLDSFLDVVAEEAYLRS